MEEYTDDETMIVMPNFKDSSIPQSEEIKNIKVELKNKLEKVYPKNQVPDNIFFNRSLMVPNLRWDFLVGVKKYSMQLEALTPTDSMMLNSINTPYDKFKNDFSICLKISFNEQYFLFMGDCSDNVLINLDEENIPNNISYLKIPHHGSKNDTMQSYIDNKTIENINVSGCTYNYKATRREVLNFYADNSDMLSITANINEKNIYNFGLIKHVYDIKNGDLLIDKSFKEGNAILDYCSV